ncbi:MAG TPA: SpoIIE family protein phosphatase [Acidimicrobiia bacterium]|nr:SpoIIE family protein phosphatase [Acidimicrobiia bacterium]
MPGDRFIELATAEDRRVLDILFRHASEAVSVQDRSGRLLYANDEAARIVGFRTGAELVSTSPEDIIGRFEMIDRSGSPVPLESLPGRRVLAGAPVAEAVIGYRRPDSPTVRWSQVRASPIKNDAGEVVWVINFFQDITSQFRRDEIRELLYTVYEALGSSLDRDENLQSLAKALVPRMGAWCAVHMLEGGTLIPVAMVHPDDEDARRLVSMSDTGPISLDDDHIQARVARTEKPEIIEAIYEEILQEAEDLSGKELIDVVRRLDLNSVACVPIAIGRRVIGTLTLARSFPEAELDMADVDVLVAVADRAAAALENASLYQQQREIAETLQIVLTPKHLPRVPGFQLAARYQPLSLVGHVGGDFYDVFPIADGRTAVLVGDIAGKGVEAAAAVGLARYTLRSTIALDPNPATVITRINESLLEEEQMCTVCYAILENQGDRFRLRVTLAGHPPVVVVTADGSVERLGEPCPPVGVMAEVIPVEVERWLAPGDMIVMYTDGYAFSGMNPPESVEVALSKCETNDPDRLLSEMLDLLLTDLGPKGPKDDIALLALLAKPPA